MNTKQQMQIPDVTPSIPKGTRPSTFKDLCDKDPTNL